MKIMYVVGFTPYWGRQEPDILDHHTGPTIGGGEEAALETAAGLVSLGHEIDLYWCGLSGFWRGVRFHGASEPWYPAIIAGDYETIVSWSVLWPLELAPTGRRRIFVQQLNDLCTAGDWSAVDCIVSPSRSHADDLIHKRLGWSGNQAVVHNGVNLRLYDGAPPWADRPMNVGYWNSPDRGLHHVLHAWPMIQRVIPEARLHVFYEIKRYLSLVQACPIGYYGERGYDVARSIVAAMADPSIVFHGQVTRRELATFQRQCRVHLYPYDPFAYCEGFSTGVCQGLAAGCVVMSTRKDALPSLYGNAVHWLTKTPLDPDWTCYVADQTVRGLRNLLPEQSSLIDRGPRTARNYAWAAAASQMDAVCRGIYSSRRDKEAA